MEHTKVLRERARISCAPMSGLFISDNRTKVIEYQQATGRSANGSLVAPIIGVHGWYLRNRSANAVVVKPRVSGFYAFVPAGYHGNEAAVMANRPGVAKSPIQKFLKRSNILRFAS